MLSFNKNAASTLLLGTFALVMWKFSNSSTPSRFTVNFTSVSFSPRTLFATSSLFIESPVKAISSIITILSPGMSPDLAEGVLGITPVT